MCSVPSVKQAAKILLSTAARAPRSALEGPLATRLETLPLETFATSAYSLRSLIFFFPRSFSSSQFAGSLIRGDIYGCLGSTD